MKIDDFLNAAARLERLSASLIGFRGSRLPFDLRVVETACRQLIRAAHPPHVWQAVETEMRAVVARISAETATATVVAFVPPATPVTPDGEDHQVIVVLILRAASREYVLTICPCAYLADSN